jgi:hypothetical protein
MRENLMTLDKLRDEIIESQKARTDLIKWKLVLVAGIGAASLGSTNTIVHANALLLALVPFVCLYVDAVCFHLDVRIMAIARFIRQNPITAEPEAALYETYCTENRPYFELEAVALQGATLILSVLVMLIGLSARIAGWSSFSYWIPDRSPAVGTVLFLAGSAGVVCGWFFYRMYRHKTNVMDGGNGWWLVRRLNALASWIASLKLSSSTSSPPPAKRPA